MMKSTILIVNAIHNLFPLYVSLNYTPELKYSLVHKPNRKLIDAGIAVQITTKWVEIVIGGNK